jgi:hypothetical protein
MVRKFLRKFSQSKHFENLMLLCVVLNTIILASDGLISPSYQFFLRNCNSAFTIIFTIDMILKILGLGIVSYIKDKMNLFDSIIVILSITELAILNNTQNSGISAFRSVRIFRTFRVLRVTRLIRSLQYMRIITNVISNSLDSLVYMFFLMMLFLCIYTLLGMQMFAGQMPEFKYLQNKASFDNFQYSFLNCF